MVSPVIHTLCLVVRCSSISSFILIKIYLQLVNRLLLYLLCHHVIASLAPTQQLSLPSCPKLVGSQLLLAFSGIAAAPSTLSGIARPYIEECQLLLLQVAAHYIELV